MTTRSSRIVVHARAVALTLVLAVAGCAGQADNEATPEEAPAAEGAPAPEEAPAAQNAADLRDVCPETIVVQGSWWPAITEGELYSLLGPEPDVDAANKRVSAPLLAQGEDTGITLEVRAGGPAIGFTQVSAQMYLDPDITIGRLEGLDEALQLSATQPTRAFLAPMDINPQMILWDPETYPQFETIRDIGQSDTTVVYVEGDTYMEYLVGSGILKRSQVDGAYDVARFVAERGRVAQSGTATHVPYIYEEIMEEWGKPVSYQLVNDAGYPNYGGALVIRPDDEERLTPCLRRLVPIIQQAQLDVRADPDETIALIARLSEEYNSSTPATVESEEVAARQMTELGLVANGDDATIGNFDEARVQQLIDISEPIYAAQGQRIKDGLEVADVVTNAFIDPAIGVEE